MAELTRPTFEPPGVDAWHTRVQRDLKGADFDKKLVTKTIEGLAIRPLYTAQSAAVESTTGPTSPWTRRGGWQNAASHREADPAAFNAAVLDDLAHGVDIITVVRGAGLSAPTLDHLDRALDGVWLDGAQVGSRGPDALAAAAQLAALWRRRGVRPAPGTALGIDPFSALAATGSLPCSLEQALADGIAAASWCEANDLADIRALTVSNAAWHDAGANDLDDLAAILAAGVAWLRAGEAAGLPPERVAAHLVFDVSVGTHFLRETAKLRALQRLWARVLDASGVAAPHTTIAVTPAARTYSRVDPWVNLLRNTVATFAGAIGGAAIITARPFDDRLGDPSALARRVARNTGTMLSEESHLSHFVDPAAGSWAIERWTDELAVAAWARFQQLEATGGLGNALTSGAFAERVASAQQAMSKQVRRRKLALTGVSMFADPREAPVERQVCVGPSESVPGPVPGWREAGFEALVAAAAEHPISTLRAATIGPNAASMVALTPTPLAAPFEALRDRAAAHVAASGSAPTVALAQLGSLADHNGRSTFATNLLAAGGLLAEPTTEGAAVAVICGTDAAYSELAETTAVALKRAGTKRVLLAGRPRTDAPSVDGYLHLGCDVVEVLEDVWATLGGES